MPSISAACESRSWSAMDTPVGFAVIPIPECTIGTGQLCAASDDRSLCGVSREGPTGRRLFLRIFRRFYWYCGESNTLKAANRRTLISTFANHRLKGFHSTSSPPRKIELPTYMPPQSNPDNLFKVCRETVSNLPDRDPFAFELG